MKRVEEQRIISLVVRTPATREDLFVPRRQEAGVHQHQLQQRSSSLSGVWRPEPCCWVPASQPPAGPGLNYPKYQVGIFRCLTLYYSLLMTRLQQQLTPKSALPRALNRSLSRHLSHHTLILKKQTRNFHINNNKFEFLVPGHAQC